MDKKLLSAGCAGLFLGVLAAGDLTVSPVFTSGMVLQREKNVPVWGTGKPGESVEVSFKGQSVKGKIGSDGKWAVGLAPMKADGKGAVLTVRSGSETKSLYNVVVGEVWILFGQSQIETSFGGKLGELKRLDLRVLEPSARENLESEIGKFVTDVQPDPQHRQCRVWLNSTMSWWELKSKNVKPFSVMGFHLAEILRKELNVPVGIINMARGCSSLESWLPEEAFTLPSLQEAKQQVEPFRRFYYDYLAKKLSDQEIADEFARYCQRTPGMSGNLKDGKPILKSYGWIWQHMRVVSPSGNYENATKHLVPFAVRGMIWWQGETNYKDKDYDQKLKLLIETYRKLWQEPELPMLVVLQGQRRQYSGSYGRFRDQQFRGVNVIPNTWLVNNISTPPEEAGMIHPYHDKVQAGKEAAALVLSRIYGKADKDGCGPIFDSAVFRGSEAEVSFRFGNGLKTADGKAPAGFELAGADGKFHPAEASVRDGKVIVTSKQVQEPRAVRYMWDDTASRPNLVNAEGLTVFPFDTSLGFFRQGSRINAK